MKESDVMGVKLTFSQLCGVVADASGVDRGVVEDFLREMFSGVADCLAEGESVKLKGIGTFKVVRVGERKSVDVTTGNDIVIASHNKVSFVASKDLAAAVNAPFSAFEAVEISDDLEERDFEDDEKSESVVEPEAVEVQSVETVVEPQVEEEVVEPEPVGEADVLTEVVDDDVVVEARRSGGSGMRHGFLIGLLGGIATVACGVVALLLLFPSLYYAVRGERVAVAKEVRGDVASVVVEKEEVAMPEQVSAEVTEVEAEVPTEVSDVVYDTISRTRYLTTMAKDHYGNYHLWPYIYMENAKFLGHPDRIKPGTRVVVPSLAKYGVDAKSKADISKAKQLGIEIYARYKGK